MNDKKILLVDDHPIVRAGCRRLLTDAGYEDVIEAENGEAALAAYRREAAAIVVLDLNLKGHSDGMAVAADLLAIDPRAAILVFSMNDDPVFAARALKAGAKGYITKYDAPTALVAAIECVLGGTVYLSHTMARELALMNHAADADPLARLSPRERKILALLGRGLTLSAIADTLGIGYKSVANSSTQIKNKLGADSTRSLIRIAIDNNLVQ